MLVPLMWNMEDMYGAFKRALSIFGGGQHYQIG
jgi:hypothetical protein